MSNHAFFEYRAKMTDTSHQQKEVSESTAWSKCGSRPITDTITEPTWNWNRTPGDLILFTLHPGPHRKISHSEIWKVKENRIAELGQA
jgi:hypothetical protein